MIRIKYDKQLSAGIILMSLLLVVGTAGAADFQNATTTNGSKETSPSQTGYPSNQSEGGYITNIEIYTANSQTQKWQGYYGNVSGSIYLNDSSSNSMYAWTVDLNNTFVYATINSTLPNTAGLYNITNSSLDTLYNFTASSDSISNTYFNYTGSQNFAGRTVVNPLSATTSAGYSDYVVSDVESGAVKNDILWAGLINVSKTGFKGQDADYELLVPVDSYLADIYYFYIELL
ncbi:MAG: hypothetical protein OIN83_10800 [Candidatus Methanoperedens sp.]|nr:hypothetical protein [Candidatus Methanoperedens sp.]